MGVKHKDSARHHVAVYLATIDKPFSLTDLEQAVPLQTTKAIKAVMWYFNSEKFLKKAGINPLNKKQKLYVVTEKGKEYMQAEAARAEPMPQNTNDLQSADYYNDPKNIIRAMKAIMAVIDKIVNEHIQLKNKLSQLSK